jgi:FAD/FMN-containing dehydrogenase
MFMISQDELAAIVGEKNVLDPAEAHLRTVRWGGNVPCECRALVMPRNSQEVAEIVRACASAKQTIVVHGGLTGMAGGAVSTATDIVISLEKLDRIESCELHGRTLLVGAGVTIQAVQEFAGERDAMFGVDFGARGSATVGGAISTNAGGNRVFRYGMMRDQVLGLEVVLADGTVLDGLKGLIKDNSGYDWKQLFIGAEGTLGIITRAVLRLRPKMHSRMTALLAFSEFDSILAFLRWFEGRLGGSLSAFEVMWQSFMSAVTRGNERIAGLSATAPFYVLVESEGASQSRDEELFVEALGEAMENGFFSDAVVARSEREREALWALREDIDTLMRMGDRVDFDISLPTNEMAGYLDEIGARLKHEVPEALIVVFGHIADNNIHAMVIREKPFTSPDRTMIKQILYNPLRAVGGSISAEHGIGIDKKAALHLTRSAAELALMQQLKRCLDPQNILNSGKIIDV